MIERKKYNNLITKIAFNKKAKYKYFIKETLEVGLVLLGWEVKAFKSGNINISDSYISFNSGEFYLIGAQFNALPTTQSYSSCIFNRDRKILLNKHEIMFLYQKMYKSGYTIITLSCFLKNNWCKMKIAIAKGKTQHDKREEKKQAQWNLEKIKIFKKIR
ncbi:MAG: SsrA-binding protein SmpB [Buchnera aphidicola (Nurudea shiraii)]